MRGSLLSTRQTTNSENVSDSLETSIIFEGKSSQNQCVNAKRSKLEFLEKLNPSNDEPLNDVHMRDSLLGNLFKKHDSNLIRLQSSKFNLITFESNSLSIS